MRISQLKCVVKLLDLQPFSGPIVKPLPKPLVSKPKPKGLGLTLKSYGPPPYSRLCHYIASCAIHPITFRGSGWEYMVQIEAPSTSECWEGVHSPGGQQREEEHRVVLHVQVEHFQKMSQDHKPKSKIPGLGLSLSTTSLVCFIRTSLMIFNKLRV